MSAKQLTLDTFTKSTKAGLLTINLERAIVPNRLYILLEGMASTAFSHFYRNSMKSARFIAGTLIPNECSVAISEKFSNNRYTLCSMPNRVFSILNTRMSSCFSYQNFQVCDCGSSIQKV